MSKSRISLSDQCLEVGWPLTEVLAHKQDKRSWSLDGESFWPPEVVVGQMYSNAGASVNFCEGGSVLLLMKAAALDALARLNIFNDRDDAINRYLEAQMVILADHTTEIIETVRTITPDVLARNVKELSESAMLQSFFSRVNQQFMLELFDHLGGNKLADILQAFSAAPYDYRAGWPDLIVLQDRMIKFVEVKTSDKLLESQLRFARGIGTPMSFDCSVVRLKALQPA
ncbi:hypothetical protein GFM10_01955 [Pseudomonas aeruginosa]|uniref:VRR-NUC domain-containing protein n=1 Tax=Pseudomonas aeruginosa TaxID=287 RepID=UPI00190CD55B|nr:VRR-NUC domain-containing protein [Pseudomonas aeruginosa]MBK3901819.1 hypothetical protein [Pseudomonas aeruginosa]